MVTLDTINDLEYLNWVIMEVLRIQAPLKCTTPLHLFQDTNIGGINIRKGDVLTIDIHAIHSDPKQWKKPDEFIPERFDHSNPISLTPSGKLRSNGAWIPFSGGTRICFGKTFAEATLKISAIYFSQAFNYKFVDKRYETELPVSVFGVNSRGRTTVIVTKNETAKEE